MHHPVCMRPLTSHVSCCIGGLFLGLMGSVCIGSAAVQSFSVKEIHTWDAGRSVSSPTPPPPFVTRPKTKPANPGGGAKIMVHISHVDAQKKVREMAPIL